MGREIRRVKKGWEHPKKENGKYQPMFNQDYETELNDWWADHQLWLKGKHPDQKEFEDTKKYKYYAEYGGNPPDVDYYMKGKLDQNDEMWFQLYETVSEGTPLSPPFKTKEELADYLAENGDFWGGSWTKEQAAKFIETEWCPSGVMINGEFYQNQQTLEHLKKDLKDE